MTTNSPYRKPNLLHTINPQPLACRTTVRGNLLCPPHSKLLLLRGKRLLRHLCMLLRTLGSTPALCNRTSAISRIRLPPITKANILLAIPRSFTQAGVSCRWHGVFRVPVLSQQAQLDNGYAQHDAKLALQATLVRRPSDVMMADATGRPATPQVQPATLAVPRAPDVGHQLRVDAMFRNVRDAISLICNDAVLSVRHNPARSLQQMQHLRAVFEGLVGETEAILHSMVGANTRSG